MIWVGNFSVQMEPQCGKIFYSLLFLFVTYSISQDKCEHTAIV